MSTLFRHDAGQPAGNDQVIQVACFAMGDLDFCLDIMRIKEIVNPIPVTTVPKAPGFIEGVCALRGAFLAVMDLRKRFALPAAALSRDSKFLVVTMAGQHVALIVDRVIEVRRVARADIGPVPGLVIGPESRFVSGVMRQDERTVLVIDLDQVLSPEETRLMHDLNPTYV